MPERTFLRAMARGAYIPEIGDYVLLPKSFAISGVGSVVGFSRGRAVVRSLTHANITVTVALKGMIVQERCSDPEHPDCHVSHELAIECARWTRVRLGG